MFPKREQLRTSYFFLLGWWIYTIPLIVIWIAIDDILAGTLWPTTVVLIAFSITDMLSKVFSPSLINRISFHSSFTLITVGLTVSILLLVTIDDVKVRLVGVTVLGFSSGFTVITSVRMLAYYPQPEVLASAYQNGALFSMLFASLGYTGMTTWFCVPPRITTACCIPMCFIPLGVYILLDKEPLKDHLKMSAKVVEYTKLPEEECSNDKDTNSTSNPTHKFLLLYKAFPLFIYGYLSNFSLHSSIAAVLTTLTFPSSPFLPRDHFQYYRLLSDTGIVIGGLISFMFGCVSQKLKEFFGVRNTAILVAVTVTHLLLFVLASWYRFLPNIMPVLVLCLTQGITYGLTRIQLIICAANLFSSPQDKGTAMGIQEVGISLGRIGAALLGVVIEQYLTEHCRYNLMLGKYCLARIPSSAGWNENMICKQ